MKTVLAAALALAAAALALTACSSPTHHDPRLVDVVAAENFWGDIVGQIGGSHVSVTSILSDPNTDPHEYESSAKDAVEMARAQLVVENGLGYDDFVGKLLAAAPVSGRAVLDVQHVLHITGSDPNPHVWYDTGRLPAVAAAIAKRLGAIDTADAAFFARRAASFDASLRPILHVIAEIRQRYAGTEIAYTERVPGYLVDAAGLKLGVPVGFTQAVEDGSDPSPADTVAFDKAITSRSVHVLLYNGQVTDPQTTQIKQLAASSGVPTVGVTETLPPSEKNFQDWQLHQAQALLTALGG